MRSGRERLVASARPIVHTAVAAPLAWLVATELLGHEQPFFAPISAVVTLGLTIGQRGRRAVEIAFGVALGIAIADTLVLAVGTGTLQIALVVALAMIAVRLVGGGPFVASQAAVSAVLVATLQPPTDGFTFDRFGDALAGGGIALAVAALVLPVDPVELIRRMSQPVLLELAAVLDDVAAALESRDSELAERALVRAHDSDALLAELDEGVAAARESARMSVSRRHSRSLVTAYAESMRNLDLAVGNVRVVARGALRAISLDDRTPADLLVALHQLAEAVRGIGSALEGAEPTSSDAGEAARRAAASANAALEETGNMSALHLIGQVRSTAVDLLRVLGADRASAIEDVRSVEDGG
ncbi:MAG: FUSC family protein [Thermoleophilaceae bacterium]